MKRLIALLGFSLLTSLASADNSLFTETLKKNVHDGRVNYRELCSDTSFLSYIQHISRTNPGGIANRKEELAFWINAYNAFTLKVICDHYPVKSINDLHTGGLILGTLIKGTIWDKKFVVINGEDMSLNHIEHDIVRKKFHDPRAHFALVCASISCPSLRAEAYEGEKLDQQLDDQATLFFSQRQKNNFEADKKIAHLSKILDWYSKDFGASKQEVLLFIAQFLPAGLAESIKADPGKWKVEYTQYDWGLND
jgi:Protein of unknown function, DUF547